jgi:hypothetical protein
MIVITATTYFSNHIMIRSQVTLARAIALIGHAGAVIPPDARLFEVRSPSQVALVPDHIIFNINRAYVPRLPMPTRRGIYERDAGRCAYCGKDISPEASTLDHVLPRSLGGQSTWENLVNCCVRCNQRKGRRTPQEASMKLLIRPFAPKKVSEKIKVRLR